MKSATALAKGRHLAIIAALVMALVGVAGKPAAADPAPLYCGGWVHAGVLDLRACVELAPGSVGHRFEVKNAVNANSPDVSVSIDRQVNGGAWARCFGNQYDFRPYQTQVFYCYTSRLSGSKYRTRGNANANVAGTAYSPTITG